VVPNTSGFRRELQRELEAIERSLKLEIPVGFDVDTAGLRAQLAALDNARVTIPVEVGDGSEIERLRARLQALDNAQITIPVDLDLRNLERADAVLRRLDGRSVRMNVRLNGVRQAIRDLTALDAIVRRLDGRNISINIDVDAAAAVAQIAAIEAALVGVRASLGSVGTSGGRAFGPGSPLLSGATQLVGLLLQVGALSLGLAVAGAAVTAAWGAVSTAVLAIPAALGLVAGPIAAIAAGMEGIERAAKTIKPQFDALRASVAATFERGMIPVFRTLATTFPTLTAGLNGIAQAMSTVALRTAEWIASAPGLALLRQNMENIRVAVLGMQPGLQNILSSILQLGAQSSVMDALRVAVNEFGASFRANVTQLIGDGTLDRAMRGLRDMLVELGQGFSDLVSNGLEVFAAAAPGVNKFLDSLSTFFNRFNWDSLGRSVGNVFRGLGETLDGVDTGTIRKIEDAFSRLGDLFRDQKFQDDLRKMVDGLPAAIDQIRAFAKDFAALGADISAAMQGFNTVDQKFREFTDGFTKSAEDLGKALGLHGEEGTIGDWLRKLDDSIDEALGIIEDDGYDMGKALREGFERGMNGIEPQFGSVDGEGWLPDIGELLKDWFSPEDTDLDEKFTDLETEIRDGMDPLDDIARLAMEQVKLVVQTGFAQLLPIATLALVALQTAFTNGFLAIGAGASLAMNTLVNTLTLGFVLMQTAVANGMLLLQTAFTTGWTLVQLAVDTGLLAMRTAFSEAFLQMQTDATNGMLLFAAAILAGFAVVVPAVTLGMTQIVLAVQLGFQQIVSAVQTGMQQVTEALQLNWGLGVSATQAAMAQMTAAVQAGMSQMVSAVQTGAQQMVSEMQAAMEQLRSAVQVGMSDAEAEVRAGIQEMNATLKTAPPLFYAAGRDMGQGLVDGLNSMLGAVRAAAAALGAAAASAMRAAAQVRSPSKLTTYYGEMMGAGLALGMRRSESEVERAARSLASTVVVGVSGVQDALASDAWAADFNARVNSELAQNDAVEAGAAGKQVTIHTEIHNPLPETGSDSVAQTHRRQAAMGIFG
jgi:hypothetical protein